MSQKTKIFLIAFVAFMILTVLCLSGVIAYLLITRDDSADDGGIDNPTASINSFEDCKNAGYPIMETYPQQCRTPDGKNFVEDVPPIDDSSTGDSTDGSSGSADSSDVVTKTVKVYFGKNPESYNDFSKVYAVNRTSTRTDIGTFALEQLIAGPTTAEKTQKYFTPLGFSGTSNCSGKDFKLVINKTTKVATVTFCKVADVGGSGEEARIINSITPTLTQFSTVTKVIILTKDGHCFGDESGLDMCLV
jgi:hypothetical protein